MKSGNSQDWVGRYKSFRFAAKGIKTLFCEEKNAVIQLLIFAVVIIAGFVLNITRQEWLIIITVSILVFAFECFNTAIEDLSDIVTKERNIKVGKIKDLAAGGVLISAVGAAVIGMIIFIPRILFLVSK